MLFIAVEPFEIRVEIMAKGGPLVEVLNLPPEDPYVISVIEQDRLKAEALAFFEERFTLAVDGIPSMPDTATANFLKIGDATSVIKQEVADEPIEDAVLGLSYVFPVYQVPNYFQLALNNLPEQIKRLPGQVRAQESVHDFEFSQYLLTFDWSSDGLAFRLPDIEPVPVARKDWLGHSKLDKAEAALVLEKLLLNIYNAFEYREESAIYDKLAVSVAGEQLAAIYLEQRQRMELVNRGGPRVKILDLSVVEIEALSKSDDTFAAIGEWEVVGTVTHFGHVHERRNRYRAKLTLSSLVSQWKITGIRMLDEQRIQ